MSIQKIVPKFRQKSGSVPFTFALAAVLGLGVAGAQAANRWWDSSAAAGVGGSATWGTTFSTTAAGTALTTAAATDDDIFEGTAGVVTLGANQTANSLTFNVSGFTLTPDATTARILTGLTSIAAGINLNLNDGAATTNRTLSLASNLSGGVGSTLTIQGAQAAGAASRVNLSATGVTISVPITISGSSTGVVGVVATAVSTSVTGIITNNSTARTDIGATSGNSITLGAKITGTAGVQFGAGDNGGTGTVTLNAASDYQGATTFNAGVTGVIKLGIDNALPTTTNVTMAATTSNGGILDLNGHGQEVASLTSSVGGGSITNNGGADAILKVSGSSSPAAFGLAITNGTTNKISLIKSGAGTLTLGAANTFTGSTTISGGSLVAAASGVQALGSTSAVSVSNGTLLLGAGNQINNSANVTIGAGGTFATGGFSEGTSASGQTAQLGTLILAATGALDFKNTSTGSSLLFAGLTYTPGDVFTIRNWTGALRSDSGAASNDRLLFITDPGLTEVQLASIQFTDDTGALLGSGATEISFNGYTELVPVPEPATIFGALALVGFVGFRERRRVTTLLSRCAPPRGA